VKKKPVVAKGNSSLEEQARAVLESPKFFRLFLSALRRERMVGEDRNALVLYIVALSAVLDRPLNAIIKGASSAGKNFLARNVLRLFPEDVIREITSSSKTAWNYSDDEFKNRVVYLQERNDAAGAVHPVRLLISEGKLVRTVTVGRTVQKFVAEGPIAAISTTTRNLIEVDDETRHISLWVDESAEQTQSVIMGYVSGYLPRDGESQKPKLTKNEIEVWRQAYALIKARAEEVSITLPEWFKTIGEKTYSGSVVVRRYFPAFVEGCRTIALVRSFHKHGRKSPSQIEVGFDDYAIASLLFEKVFVESLHKSQDENLKTRMAVKEISETNDGAAVDARLLAEHLSVSEDRAYKMLRDAFGAGLISRANKPQKGNAKFYLAAPLPRFVPKPEDVLRDIPEIATPVQFINPLSGELVNLVREKKPTNKQGG
jgi:hypothetical protein